jgi:hypothetical protein
MEALAPLLQAEAQPWWGICLLIQTRQTHPGHILMKLVTLSAMT